MDARNFLAHVLPATGPYCIARGSLINGKISFFQLAAEDLDEAASIALAIDQKRKETFYAVGALISSTPVIVNNKAKISRAAENIRGLRTYFADLDVAVNKYASQADAITALKAFCQTTKLPRPTIVSSGGGIHAYWTLEDEVPRLEWVQYAERLKALTVTHGLLNDTQIIGDSARVLRVVGTHNFKQPNNPRLVQVLMVGQHTPNAQFHNLLGMRNATSVLAIHGPPPAIDFGTSNTDRYEDDPLDPKALMENCQVVRFAADKENQQQGKAMIPEPVWMGMLTFAANMKKEDGIKFAHFVSRHDPRYNATSTEDKLADLKRRNIGPVSCAKLQGFFHQHPTNSDCCNECPSKGLIKSPARVAHVVEKAAPIEIPSTPDEDGVAAPAKFVPDPPFPYVRTPKGIGIQIANPKLGGVKETHIFCEYDMHPVRLRYDEQTMLEDDILWRVHMPHEGWIDVSIPHAQRNQLQSLLAKRGVYITEHNIQQQAGFMTAYARQLQSTIQREKAFSKLGFRDNGEFVLGEKLYRKDGTVETHSMSHALQGATGGGLLVIGDYDQWRTSIALYAKPGLEPYRAYLYSTFGSLLYHMTGYVATAISASGRSGLGKTTLLDACASVWGDPARLKVYGDPGSSTRAAAEVRANAMHHLPVFMDEITEREAKDVSQLIFSYSSGMGKIRSTATGGIRSDTAKWSNFLLLTGNADEYERMSSVHRDSLQHLMRLVQIEFTEASAKVLTKAEGDQLHHTVLNNFGWAGHVFAAYVAQHYRNIEKRVLQLRDEIDARIGAKSEERYWTAWAACAQVGAEIAVHLGILPNYPVSHDAQWMEDQIARMRLTTNTHTPMSGEIMSEFLDAHLPHTLALNSQASNNIDNIVHEPRRELYVRYEIDSHTCFVSRQQFRAYCRDAHINSNRVLAEMTKQGALLSENAKVTLGRDTPFAKGQVRCLVIDIEKLSGKPNLVSVATGAAAGAAASGPALPAQAATP